MGKRCSSPLTLKSLLMTAGFCAAATGVLAECAEDTVGMRGAFGSAQFDVTVADTNDERARGLMFVEQMDPMAGMLFVYERPQRVSFWMRNTLIPLDMVFVGADGVVDHIHPNAQPLDETPIFGGTDIQYVLELNGGMADRLGLAVGDEMQHPSFAGEVAWPCGQN